MTGTVRLRYLAEVNPQTPAFDQIPDEEPVTFMPLETVWADGRIDTSRSRPKSEVSTGYMRFAPGDILSPKVTPTFQAGRSALITSMTSPAGAASTEVHVVRARPSVADSRFVRYGLLTKPFLDEGVSRFQGVAGLQRVPDEFIRDLPLLAVELDEQRRIADFLDDQVARIENITAARRRQGNLLHDEFRAARDDVTLGKDAAKNWAPARWEPFGRVPAGWQQTQLRSMPSTMQTGPFGSQLHSDEYVDDGWPVVNPAGLRDSRIVRVPGMNVSDEVRARLSRHVLHAGDVVFGRRGELGRAALVTTTEEGWLLGTGSLMVRLSARAGLLPGYLVRLLETAALRFYFESVSVGSTMANLNVPILSAMPVVVPVQQEQQQVIQAVQRLEEAHREATAALARSADLLDELKRSLITAAVSGEFDVSTADGSQVPV